MSRFHHLDNATVTLFSAFESAFDALLDSTVDFVLQVAVHPSVTETVARYRGRAMTAASYRYQSAIRTPPPPFLTKVRTHSRDREPKPPGAPIQLPQAWTLH